MSRPTAAGLQAPSSPIFSPSLPGKFRGWPTCQRCGAHVEHVTITEVPKDNAVEVVAECHGETETSRVSNFEYHRADTITLGVAFGSAATPPAADGAR